MTSRLREGGGLLGAGSPLPVRSIEWGVLALVLGIAAGFAWPRVPLVIGLALAACAAGGAPFLTVLAAEAKHPAVVTSALRIEGLDLLPGQVVEVKAVDRTRARVAAGRAVEGWVPADGVVRVQEGAQPGGGS